MTTRNPPPPYTPETKMFMRQYVDDIGGIGAFAARHNLDHRTAQRIYSGKYAPSESLVAECQLCAKHFPGPATNEVIVSKEGPFVIGDADVPY